MLTEWEKKLLIIIYESQEGLNLTQVKNIYQQSFFLRNKDWRRHSCGLPNWEYSLRKTYHTLKDKKLITGNEFQKWELTQEGETAVKALYVELGMREGLFPSHRRKSISQIIRDTPMARKLKKLYQYKCQVCGMVTRVGKDEYYAEGHHMCPLGNPHNGPDVQSNILILCVQHHLEFDYQIIALNPLTLVIEHHDPSHPFIGKSLLYNFHELDKIFLMYHYGLFLKKGKTY